MPAKSAYKSIACPGSVAGMVYAERKYGKLTLQQVMAPAIKLARDGYALTWEEARDFHDRFLAEFAESHRVFQRNGDYYKPGEVFRQPDLARTLERIAAKPDDFYRGAGARTGRCHAKRRRPDHRRRSGALRSEGARAGTRYVSRI
jgi:gamma-glutamyltranspeptidase/glutathione hydrolase